MIRERVVTFGEGLALVGILAEPAQRDPARPAVLLWNAGLVHRVGPGRLNTILARRLAEDGFLVLRFDLSGLGDSGVRTDGLAGSERATADLRAALDWLGAEHGTTTAILMGLCSAADQAHRAAVADARVVGLVSLDGYAFPTFGFYLRRAAAILSDRQRVAGRLQRLCRRLCPWPREAAPDKGIMEDEFRWAPPPKADTEAELRGFVQRGMRMLYAYSGEAFDNYNHAGQFARMFRDIDFRGQAQALYFPAADHLFSLSGNQAELIDVIRAWAGTHYPPA